jgi:glycosyltransferase involved in cell wall biosynthesis
VALPTELPDLRNLMRESKGPLTAPSSELQLLVQCARPRVEQLHEERVRALVASGIDWSVLLQRAAWHRMMPLLHWHIAATCRSDVPEEARTSLQSEFVKNAHRMLRLSAELTSILSALRESGVPALPYKGPLLGARLYNNIALRASGDLDILVRRRDVAPARELLIARGYRPRHAISSDRLPFMLANRYSEPMLRAGFAEVELHWAFTNRDVSFALDCDTLLERARTTRLGGVDLQIMAHDDLALVLCVHGAKHRWNRLEWIAGRATLIRAVPDLDYDALLSRAQVLRSRRRVLLGLLVAHEVLDAPVPNEIVDVARADHTVPALSKEVWQSLEVVHTRSPHVERSASLPFDWFHLRLSDSLQDRMRLVTYRLTTPSQPERWNTITWRKHLVPLHAVVRPLHVALRIGPATWSFIQQRNARNELMGPPALGVHNGKVGVPQSHSQRQRVRPSSTDPLRILQLVQKPQRRGAEIFAHAFNQWAGSRGHHGRMVYLYPHAGRTTLPLALGDVVVGQDEAHWCERVPGVQLGLLRRLRGIVADFRPDIVVLNGSRTVKYGALLRMLEPRSNWKLVYRNIDSPKFWLRGAVRTLFYRQVVMPRVDAVIGISQRTLSEVVSVYQLRVPHIFVPNAVDFDQLKLGLDGADVRAATHTPADAIVALFIGHLSRQKRPDRFLRVLQRAVSEVPNVYGWLLGDGPDRVALEAQARELGIEQHVRFLGYQDKVAPYVAASDMYVSTSDTEGLPTVVIEAGYLGKPTVAMRVGGMDECVRDIETGLLADRGDERTLIDHLVRLARDHGERERMGVRASAWMSEEFAMSRVGEEYLAFFSSLLGVHALAPAASGVVRRAVTVTHGAQQSSPLGSTR